MEPDTSTNNNNNNAAARTNDEIYRHPKKKPPPLPMAVDADCRMESMNAAAAVAVAAAMQQPQPPPRKKQKVQERKPPPIERMQGSISEESKLSTIYEASEMESETTRRLLLHPTGATRQNPFLFSPRQYHPMTSRNFTPPEARLVQSGNGLNRLHPVEYNESSIFSASQQQDTTPRQSVSNDLVASSLPPSGSFQQLHSASGMAAPRPFGAAAYYWHRVVDQQQAMASPPPSNTLPNWMMIPPLARGFHTAVDALRAPNAEYNTSSSASNLSFRGDNHLTLAPSHSTYITDTLSQFHHSRTATQILEDMLRAQQEPLHQVVGVVAPSFEHQETALTEPPTPSVLTTRSALRMPAIIGQSSDTQLMNAHQVFLRQQIEVFEATQDDLYVNTRGRNKRIHIGQVGIRCRHCAHIPARQRQKGTMYFPNTMSGLYQAAQNMSTNHIQCGLCAEMPDSVKTRFIELWPTRNTVSRVGRKYWEESARQQLGLVDTEDGIAFEPNTGTT